jgi:hypothetical protein
MKSQPCFHFLYVMISISSLVLAALKILAYLQKPLSEVAGNKQLSRERPLCLAPSAVATCFRISLWVFLATVHQANSLSIKIWAPNLRFVVLYPIFSHMARPFDPLSDKQ